MRALLTACIGLLAAACSTTAADLAYSPSNTPPRSASATIASVAVSDERSEKDPNYVGAIRGGYGNPLKTIVSKQPIPDEVRQAFDNALRARNMLAPSLEPGQSLTVSVRLTKLSANQYAGRHAAAAFSLQLLRSGQPVYADAVDVENDNGGFFSFDNGILASTDDLRALMDRTLSQAIDQALDKPGFVAAASPAPAS